MTPATRQYKAYSYAVNNHEVTTLTKRDTLRDTQRDTLRDTQRSHGEVMCEVPPVFTRIRNSVEDYLHRLFERKIYCNLGQKAKRGP